MPPVNRIGFTKKATASTVWTSCFANMKWETWDIDISELSEVSGPLENGTTFNFVMKDSNIIAPCVLSNVKENESFTFSGQMLKGIAKFKGTVLLKPVPDDEKKHTPNNNKGVTEIDYTFEMYGPLGGLMNFFKSKEIINGTEKGLEKMIEISDNYSE